MSSAYCPAAGLRQRLPDEDMLRRETQALVQERNAARATINWRFNTQDARTKLHRLYPFANMTGLGGFPLYPSPFVQF